MSQSETVICLYRVKRGQEDEFLRLLERHWPTLRDLGLATDDAPQHYRGAEQSGEPLFVEIFQWASADAAGYVLMPNVNTMGEMMDMREAQRSYTANLNVIEASKTMLLRTIDILRA